MTWQASAAVGVLEEWLKYEEDKRIIPKNSKTEPATNPTASNMSCLSMQLKVFPYMIKIILPVSIGFLVRVKDIVRIEDIF